MEAAFAEANQQTGFFAGKAAHTMSPSLLPSSFFCRLHTVSAAMSPPFRLRRCLTAAMAAPRW
jgi:hypothetical protein